MRKLLDLAEMVAQALAQVVDDVVEQHRRRLLLVGAGGLADVAKGQRLPCAQRRLEQGEGVLLAAAHVEQTRMSAHDVEGAAVFGLRELPVVQPADPHELMRRGGIAVQGREKHRVRRSAKHRHPAADALQHRRQERFARNRLAQASQPDSRRGVQDGAARLNYR